MLKAVIKQVIEPNRPVIKGCPPRANLGARELDTVMDSRATMVMAVSMAYSAAIDQRQLVLPVATTIFAGHIW